MTKDELRIVFMGTPSFAVSTLRALVDAGYHIVGVVTQPDRPVGRHGSAVRPSPVKDYAMAHGLPILQPEKMRDETFICRLRALKANLQIVVAFRMLPEIVWAMPEYGTFNVHASLLPEYRGAAPINWAIINGETVTGITTFFIDHDIDTGRIIMQRPYPIAPDSDAEQLSEALASLGASVCLDTLRLIIDADGHPASIAQATDSATEPKTAPKIFKETCRVDFSRPAQEVYNFIRGLSPTPGAWSTLHLPTGEETTIKIYRSSLTAARSSSSPGKLAVHGRELFLCCKDYLLRIDDLQLAGKRRMSACDFLNGFRLKTGLSSSLSLCR